MKNVKQFILLTLVFTAIIIAACSKKTLDVQAHQLTPNEILERYTKVPNGLNPVLQKIADKLKQKDAQKPFIIKTGSKVGVPLWSKAQFKSKHNTAARASGNETTVLIPISIPSTTEVAGFIAATVDANNNVENVGEYDKYNYYLVGFGKASNEKDAEDVAMQCLILQNDVYGKTKFKILDNRLFHFQTTRGLEISLGETPSTTNTNSRIVIIKHNHCTGHADTGPNGHEGGDCDECDWCGHFEYEILFIDGGGDPSGGGGGGGTGNNGGGNNGGGGGTGSNNDTSGNHIDTTTNPIDTSTTTGWVPISTSDDDDLSNKTVRDSLDSFPCTQQILKRMKDLQFVTKSILISVFGVSDSVNITFTAADTTKGINAITSNQTTNPSNGVFSAKVLLNAKTLNAASAEKIAAIMYHESIHAFLDYKKFQYYHGQLDSNTFKSHYPLVWNYANITPNAAHHNQMAATYTGNIKNLLLSLNNNLPDSVATALSWTGLFQTDAFTSLPLSMQNSILSIHSIAGGDSGIIKMQQYGLHKCY